MNGMTGMTGMDKIGRNRSQMNLWCEDYVVSLTPRDAWIQCIHGYMVRIQLFYKYPTTRIQYPIVSAVLAKYPQNPDTCLTPYFTPLLVVKRKKSG